MYSSTAWRAAAPAGSQIGRPAPTSGSVWNSSSSRPSRWWSIILGSPSPLEGRRAHHPVREAAPERCAPRGPVKLRSQSGHARPRRDSARRRAQIRATHGFHGIRRRFAGATSLPSLPARDRKSTRLNSSHVRISYAVFCLKKKKKQKTETIDYTKKKKQKNT